MTPATPTLTREAVYAALGTIPDPCMRAAGQDLSLVDLGLIGGVEVEGSSVQVEITFTEVGCLFTHRVVAEIYDTVGALPGVEQVEVTPRWLPIWTEERLSPKAAQTFAASRARAAQRLGIPPPPAGRIIGVAEIR